MYIKAFIAFIVCFIIFPCFAQTSRIIIRSLPLECEVLIGQNNDDGKIPKLIEGGSRFTQPPFLLGIKKVEDMVIIEDIPEGNHPIVFRRGDKKLESEISIQPGKILLVQGDFNQRKILITPEVFIGKDKSPMVLIPAGEFQMGSDNGESDEQPIHKVYVDEFYMDIYEVTNALYKKFMDATGREAPLYWNDPKCNAPDQPVVGVAWQDARDYCKWAGKRLPTEAEWEKAARGGLVGKDYPWGDDEGSEAPSGNENPGLSGAYSVGSFPPNNYHLHDMERNAWEWCVDWYGEEYYSVSPDRNPKGPESGEKRILRGGSWFAGVFTPLRIAYRYSYDPLQTSNLIGFRCVNP